MLDKRAELNIVILGYLIIHWFGKTLISRAMTLQSVLLASTPGLAFYIMEDSHGLK